MAPTSDRNWARDRDERKGTRMSRQAELFDKAADCERAMNTASEPWQKVTFRLLRDMWIALANESLSMTKPQLANEIAAIEEIQSAATGPAKAPAAP
jgi:hypothetical protein